MCKVFLTECPITYPRYHLMLPETKDAGEIAHHEEVDAVIDQEAERKLVMKLDSLILPLTTLLYLSAL